MNEQPKAVKKSKTKSHLEIRDLKAKKDPKGGGTGDPDEGGQYHKPM